MNYQRNNMRYSGVKNGVQNSSQPRCGGCGDGDRDGGEAGFDCLHGMSLAMVYSPCQEFDDLYDHTEGFRHGTIFRALDKPFTGKGGRGNG